MSTKRALIVDDSPIIRKMVRAVVETMGYEIIEAENGKKALEALESSETPQLAFVDVNMPIMNGVEFAIEVSKKPAWSKMAMIMLTTEVNTDLKNQAKLAGVKLWVLKPIVANRLRKAIEMVGAV